METVVLEGSVEMEDDEDCQRAYGADDMDANECQTSLQVQMVNDDSAIPCQHDETAEVGVQSPPVMWRYHSATIAGKKKRGKPSSVRQARHC